MSKSESVNVQHDQELDALDLRCPMPLLKTRQALRYMTPGQVLMVSTRDPGSWHDIPAYIGQSSHHLVHYQQCGDEYRFWIEAGGQADA